MIEDLMQQYFDLIQRDHHKRKDMYFTIRKCWSYAEFKGYEVVHDGYVNECWSDPFETYAEAEKFLIKTLTEWIAEEKRVMALEESNNE
jgi:hypothetical protein